MKENWSICRYALVTAYVTAYTLCLVSVGTLAALSVDRLLALLHGTEIQTSCNFKTNLRDAFYLMAFARCLFSNVLLESPL